MHIYSISYSIYSIFSSKLTFKSWILTSEKRGPSCPNWGHGEGGGLGNSGNAQKKTFFFQLTPFLSTLTLSTTLDVTKLTNPTIFSNSKRAKTYWLTDLQSKAMIWFWFDKNCDLAPVLFCIYMRKNRSFSIIFFCKMLTTFKANWLRYYWLVCQCWQNRAGPIWDLKNWPKWLLLKFYLYSFGIILWKSSVVWSRFIQISWKKILIWMQKFLKKWQENCQMKKRWGLYDIH